MARASADCTTSSHPTVSRLAHRQGGCDQAVATAQWQRTMYGSAFLNLSNFGSRLSLSANPLKPKPAAFRPASESDQMK